MDSVTIVSVVIKFQCVPRFLDVATAGHDIIRFCIRKSTLLDPIIRSQVNSSILVRQAFILSTDPVILDQANSSILISQIGSLPILLRRHSRCFLRLHSVLGEAIILVLILINS